MTEEFSGPIQVIERPDIAEAYGCARVWVERRPGGDEMLWAQPSGYAEFVATDLAFEAPKE
jgi:hypothetical protein